MEYYKEKYEQALENLKKIRNSNENNKELVDFIEYNYPELKESEDEMVRKHLLKHFSNKTKEEWNGMPVKNIIAWLEKRGEQPNKVSIWKHWKDGIAGNGEGKTIFLVKNGNTYSISSCLVCECDYIELSELDKLMVEKQGEQMDIANKEYWRGYREGKQEILDKYSELEKQGEQKSTDKVEPKFKIENGQWYICIQSFVLNGSIVVAKGRTYESREDNTISGEDARLFIDKHDGDAAEYFKPWTIQDARDGDVLNDNRAILLFRSIGNRNWKDVISFYAILETNLNNRFSISDDKEHWGNVEDCKLKPASKEQRDTLMKAMADAGYTFDFEKKELKKIEQKPTAYFYCKYGGTISKCSDCKRNHLNSKYERTEIDTWMIPTSRSTKQCLSYIQQKPAWSEEDEKFFKTTLWHISHSISNSNCTNVRSNTADWLKSLKERMKGE